MQQIYKSFKGTVREFVAAGVSVNGKSLDQPSISMMAQYGVIKKVGTVPRPKGKKGHEEIIYQVVGKAGMKVEYAVVAETQVKEVV